jgi:hypothetical protein
LKHLRSKHPSKCRDITPKENPNPSNVGDFFAPRKMSKPFDEGIFVGKLLTWIIKTDQAFSVVDDHFFADLLDYLKKDISINSSRTLMRRMEELYQQKKSDLKDILGKLTSKFSLTCDVWTSKNQLAFFGFTIHYVDSDWFLKHGLLAFKFL